MPLHWGTVKIFLLFAIQSQKRLYMIAIHSVQMPDKGYNIMFHKLATHHHVKTLPLWFLLHFSPFMLSLYPLVLHSPALIKRLNYFPHVSINLDTLWGSMMHRSLLVLYGEQAPVRQSIELRLSYIHDRASNLSDCILPVRHTQERESFPVNLDNWKGCIRDSPGTCACNERLDRLGHFYWSVGGWKVTLLRCTRSRGAWIK